MLSAAGRSASPVVRKAPYPTTIIEIKRGPTLPDSSHPAAITGPEALRHVPTAGLVAPVLREADPIHPPLNARPRNRED